ncbi:MAG: class I SAM-dependent methyltransferase [Pseudomonadota bacterium]
MLTRRRPALADLYADVAAGWQAGIERLGYPAAYTALFTAAPLGAPGRVLDLGTGSGAFAEAALRAAELPAESLALLDTSPEMLAAASARLQSHATTTTHNVPVGTDALPLSGFDTVLAAHVIEHLEDPQDALRWCRARLAPGGQFYLAVSRPHWCTALLRWKWGHRAYRPETVVALLKAAGFANVRHVAFPAGPPSRTSAGYVAT